MYLIAGNGGLAAEASHFAAELTGKYHKDVYIPCIDLGSNEAQLTALTNDIGWENVYAHLVSVFGKEGDTFIGMTTSRAENILNACAVARLRGLDVILLDKDTLVGEDTAEKQEYAIKYLLFGSVFTHQSVFIQQYYILNACAVARLRGLDVILLDKDTLVGEDTAEKQEYAIKYLHQLARRIKDNEGIGNG